MGKWFLTDNSATVGRILMTYSAHPNEISILIKWWKNQPSSTSACAQTSHYAFSGFWPIMAYFCPKVLRFYWVHFFSFEHINMKFSGINQQCWGNIWSKKSRELTHITSFLAKNVPRTIQKWVKFFLAVFVKSRFNLWAKDSEPRKKEKKISSLRYKKSLKFEFVCSRISTL